MLFCMVSWLSRPDSSRRSNAWVPRCFSFLKVCPKWTHRRLFIHQEEDREGAA
ncbi:hypothetical protein MPNT_20185 [Candidatus Methylacidithermus pantelleriae]|uniref:Uncharacterized protein n=1 Tax=Candidatus Methylacidithermus pantelleriae TaxID=2744239 RepID=A0A8J2FNK6_9BACT|nr:hypothetical protein MPNT_20185 [Candidatus Methylacidithermus pantelleriae]